MHDPTMNHMGMEQDQHHHVQEGISHDGQNQWVDFSPIYPQQHHQSPVHEYTGFAFSPHHGLPMEPTFNQHNSMAPPRTTHQQLQPLIMPQWPSMLTSQSTYVPPMMTTAPVVMPIPTPTSATPISASSTGSRYPSSTPRRTLTDDDRRRMCLYHEEHPKTKQTDIGAMFGVERSTVSKVLRNKEKYLMQDDGSRSPVKRHKGKFPDIERALANWARKQQKDGLPLTDSLIREKARFFAANVGSTESGLKTNSSSWLEKFKQKNNLMGAKSRKGSLAAEDSEGMSNPGSNAHTPGNISPSSPQAVSSPSPIEMEDAKSQEGVKLERAEETSKIPNGHRPFHSTSNTSLSSFFTDTGPSTFSAGPTSPTSPFFTPDSACGTNNPFGISNVALPPVSTHQPRPRSQTLPLISGIESYFSPATSEPLTPKFLQSATLESPMSDLPIGHMDETLATSSRSHRPSTSTASSMQPPPPPSQIALSSSPVSPVLQPKRSFSIPGSPTQDDARRALEVVMNFFQSQPQGFCEPQEYMMLGKFMEKLKIHRQGAVTPNQELPGGLHRIGE